MGNSISSTSTTRTEEYMKPVFVKAGIPLALSVTGFLCAKVILKTHVKAKSSSLEDDNKVIASLDQTIDSQNENFIDKASDHGPSEENQIVTTSRFMKSIQDSDFHDYKADSGQEEIIEELEKRETEIESQMLHQVIQEHESLLVDIKSILTLEATRTELLNSQVSLMESEKDRFENLMREHLKAVEQLGIAKLENRLLHRKVKKLLKKNDKELRIIKEKDLKINSLETKILRGFDFVEKRNFVIIELKNQVHELQVVVNSLQEEKNELLVKLSSVENSASSFSKSEAEEGIKIEEYKQLVNELERLRKDIGAETTELIHLRWTNACLRHELTRCHYQQEEQIQDNNTNHLESKLEESREIEDNSVEHIQQRESVVAATSSSNKVGGKRKKLFQKLKKMVEGSENVMRSTNLEEREKNETNCFRGFSVSEDTEEESVVLERRSYSSA